MAENITSFGTTRFAPVFAPCMDSYGCGDAARYEWPNNVLSTKLVVYDSGVIAKQGGSVVHRVDRIELERCERLARQAEAIMGKQFVGMKSESDSHFQAYFQVVNQTAESTVGAPSRVDAS